jgi:hypothetical protein
MLGEIPYSVRDKTASVTRIRGFNFNEINTNQLFKKEDDENISGANIYSVNGRIGIGVQNPEEDLELDGNIQLDTGGAQRGRVIFYDKQGDHEHSEIDGLGEGTNGGVLAFYTKLQNGSVTEKLRINNKGAFGVGGANYGTSGQVIVSNGPDAAVSWAEQNQTTTLDELTDVVITSVANNQVLIYDSSSSKWINNYIQLNKLSDINFSTLQNGNLLRYNSLNSKWENTFLNINDINNVEITTPVSNGSYLVYNTTTSKWENKVVFETLAGLADVTITGVSSNDLLRYNGSIWENTKIALDNNFTNINFTSLTNGDLIKYDGSNFINFVPTYLDGAGIADNNLIKVVSGATTATSLYESSVSGVSTSLRIYVPGTLFSILAGTIETEIFDTTKQRINITTSGIASTNGITITSDGRVGIGITDPEEDLEVAGSIQIDSANVARLKFQKSGPSPHALGEIDGEADGTTGGDLQFYTKVDGGSVTEKIRINNIGAIGIGGANFGSSNQVLISNGSGSSVSWANQTDTTYTAGTGLSLVGTTFNNTAPDQTVTLTQGGSTTITGTYPNFTISSTDTTYSAGTGLSLVGTTFNNTAPDQTVTLTQGGATTISGTYPNFTISSTNTTYSAGTGMSLVGTTFSIGQSVGTTDSVTFGGLTVTGNGIINNGRVGDMGYGANFAGFAHNSLSQPNNYAILQQNTGQTFINASSGQSIDFRINNGTNKMIIDGNGLGIGGGSLSGYPLYITGTCASSNGFNGGGGGAAWFGTSFIGNIQPILNANFTYNVGTSGAQYFIGYAFSWSSSSDDRLKDNETDISNALETIMKLKPQSYDFKSSEEPDAKHLGLRSGFIAQDVLEIPELAHAVNVPENETEKVGKEVDESGNIIDSDKEKQCYLSLDYNTIFTHAVKAIQELNEKVKTLENEINILKNK